MTETVNTEHLYQPVLNRAAFFSQALKSQNSDILLVEYGQDIIYITYYPNYITPEKLIESRKLLTMHAKIRLRFASMLITHADG